jgi:hypothetical protein
MTSAAHVLFRFQLSPRAFHDPVRLPGSAFHSLRSILPTGSRDLSGKTPCLGVLFSNFSISLSVNIVRVELEFGDPRPLVVRVLAFGRVFPLGVCTDSEAKLVKAKGIQLAKFKVKKSYCGIIQ